MKKGTERIFQGVDLTIYHQNIPKRKLQAHKHDEAHLFIPLEGKIRLTVNDREYPIPSGQMMYISGSVEHSFHADSESGERVILQFNEDAKLFRAFEGKSILLPLHPLVKDLCLSLFPYQSSPFVKTMEKLIQEIIHQSLIDQTKGGGNSLFKIKDKILGCSDPLVARVLQVMEQDLELSIDVIAKKSGVSPRNLTRVIKTEIGLSPKDLYTYFRVVKACELIFQGNMGLTAVAFECGYASLSQFINNFKKWTGQKPSEFSSSH